MENNILLALIVGITSSLIATAVFIGLSLYIRKIALPWYADKIYRGVRIDGKWGTFGENSPFSMSFELEQKGDVITGLSILPRDEETTEEIYTLSGNIRDSVFCATLRSKSPYHLDACSCTLRIICPRDFLEMHGILSAISHEDNTVVSYRVNFRRTGG